MKILLLVLLGISMSAYGQNCNCNHLISLSNTKVDGNVLSILPGDIVCIESGTRERLKFKNMTGTAANPIIIKNCGGQVNIMPTTHSYGVKIENCDYVQFSGSGDNQIEYGFKISQTSGYGMTMGKLTNHFEIDHFLFEQTGNYAVYYKNNPSCDLSANKGVFVLGNSKLHHLKIINSYKGIRIGHPNYDLGVSNSSCGVLEPHSIENLSLTDLYIENITNGDAIRLYGASVTLADNTLETISGRGVTVGTHCDLTAKRNFISNTEKEGIRALGSGSYQIHNNVLYNTGDLSHSAIELAFENSVNYLLGNKLMLTNNTIINPALYGLCILNPSNVTSSSNIKNNIFLNPGGSLTTNSNSPYLDIDDLTGFVISHNELTMSESSLKFVDYDSQNFHITHESPLINKGDHTLINLDFDKSYRNLAGQVDIGAFEYVPERIAYFDQISLQGLYVNKFKHILGDEVAENELLSYALDSGFNYLLLYNMDYIKHNLYDITDPAEAVVFANFIEKAKTEYGIVQVGVVGENNESFDKIETFNNLYNSNWHQTVDVLNLEFEFWANTAKSTFGYYCTKYLTPNSFPCTNQGAFDYSFPQMTAIDQRAQSMQCISEIYLGSPNSQRLSEISEVTDRILLHHYRASDTYNNGNSIYNYKTYRLQEIAQSTRQPSIMPIFSARSYHMGPWLESHSITQPMDTWLNGQNSYYNDASVQNLNISGYQWYRYSDLKPSATMASSQNSSPTGENWSLITPNSKVETIVNVTQFDEYTAVGFEGENEGSYLIQIIDMSGKIIFTETTDAENQVKINTTAIQKGVYVVMVRDNLTKQILKTSKLMY